MKRLTTFLLLLAFFIDLSGQGAFLKPFGTSYQTVRDFLDQQELASFDYSEEGKITVWTGEFKMVYHFHDHLLYKAETQRNYHDRKAVLAAINSIRAYYQRIQGDEMVLNDHRDAHYLAFFFNRELHEVSQIDLGKGGFQLKQVRMSLANCPHPEFTALQNNPQLLPLIGTN